MTEIENSAALGRGKHVMIEVAGIDLVFHQVRLDTTTPTGGKIAMAGGFSEDKHAYVLQWREGGGFEDLSLHEEADLSEGLRFIVAESSGTDRITVNGNRIDWLAPVISGSVVRKLGGIPPDELIYLEREDEADRQVLDSDLIPIKGDGVEEFKSRKAVWELSVQGVKIKANVPEIMASQALLQAGFDDPTAWIITLRAAGQPKRQLNPTDIIDLSAPGLEKVRLTPKQVDNGEAHSAPRRQFDLLAVDEAYLDSLELPWETMVEGGNRWLVIKDYAVSEGYQSDKVQLALLVPTTYPQAQIDMFYVHPPLTKLDGGTIPNLMQQAIGGVTFQVWSRHRGQISAWNSRRDNVVTHLALVESAIAKEVGQ